MARISYWHATCTTKDSRATNPNRWRSCRGNWTICTRSHSGRIVPRRAASPPCIWCGTICNGNKAVMQPTDTELDGWLGFSTGLALAAGQAIMKIYDSPFEVRRKLDKSPLTAADIAAHELIVREL